MKKEVDNTSHDGVAVIKATLQKFARLYAAYDGLQELTPEELAKKINSGDCGLTAIAVHHVLKHHYGIETHIVLCRNHCWLDYEGVDYDTLRPDGYEGSAADFWEKEANAPRHYLSFPEACEEWMSCDVKGAVIVKAFCAMYWTAFPAELQHCLDNADEYERPGELANYEARMQSILATI